jgi:hypothetical protein
MWVYKMQNFMLILGDLKELFRKMYQKDNLEKSFFKKNLPHKGCFLGLTFFLSIYSE